MSDQKKTEVRMDVIGSAISRKGTCLFSRWQVRLYFPDLVNVNVKVTAMQYLLHLGVRYDKDKNQEEPTLLVPLGFC